uniref:FHA domain-containing protein n=1 Tax=Desertifilum tharense IPPAS B-1220 TaxID=1781255 RepID=A0ACD5GMB9_9CYAN
MTQPSVTLESNPHLVLQTDSGKRYLPLVGSNCWTIGRSEDNNLVLSDPWISRNHAMLQCTETGDYYLIDLGSRNGSFVNGRRVSVPVTLKHGDRLTFGQTELDFYCPSVPNNPSDAMGLDSGEFNATATLHVRRLISVVVVDIRNFTVLTRQLDETVLSEMIGSWFRHAGNIIRQRGSWVDKYIGDAIIVVWFHGTQGVNQEELFRILHALSDLHKMTEELTTRHPLPFPLRIGAGLNTGYAMVGNTGSGDRPDYTALGDTVNSAFRLETCTKQIGQDVALGKTTYQYLASFSADPTGFAEYSVNLKGYETPTITYACSFDDLDKFLLTQETPESEQQER